MDNNYRIARVLDLERIDRDIFRGAVIESTLRRTYGGQVAAQSLVAAVNTVDPKFSVHSLHSYFLAAGRPEIPTIFLVDRLRDGRSFSSRQVKAIQDGRTIFVLQASFHIRDDHGPEHSDAMRAVPRPEDIDVSERTLSAVHRALLDEWSDWDIRIVPPHRYEPNKFTTSQQVVWFRTKHRLPDDDITHVCTLTYMSDMTLLGSALVPHPDEPVQEASLDHALWFLRPFRADEWLLYDQYSPSAHGGRALTHGRIFDSQGQLVAVATQEGLTRHLRAGEMSIPVTEEYQNPPTTSQENQ